MINLKSLAAVALGLVFCVPARANTKAQFLQEMCQADDRVQAALAANNASHLKNTDAESSAFCNGFIMGWAQTINGTAEMEENADLTFFTFGDDFNFQQGKKIFLTYIADHPEHLYKPASFVLKLAMTEKNVLRKSVLPLSKAGVEPAPDKK